MSDLEKDYERYGRRSRMPRFQYHYRKAAASKTILGKYWHLVLLRFWRGKYLCDFPSGVKIGEGLFINHPYCITLNPDAVLGSYVSLHKGVTIGQENRG